MGHQIGDYLRRSPHAPISNKKAHLAFLNGHLCSRKATYNNVKPNVVMSQIRKTMFHFSPYILIHHFDRLTRI